MHRFAAIALVFVSCGVISAQNGQNAWELADPNARILIGVDVRSLKESPIVQAAAQSAGDSWKQQIQNRNFGNFHMPGMELLHDIDRVFISSAGEKTPVRPATVSAAKPASASGNPSFLAVIEGSFPAAHYQALLNGPKRTYRGIAVYKMSKTGEAAIAVVDEHTIVIGDEKSVFGALDRRGRGMQPQSEAMARASALASSNDIWIVVKDAASAFADAPATTGPAAMAAQLASQIDGLEIGTSLHDGFKTDLTLVAKTEAVAQMFAGLLSTQLQAAAARPDHPQAAEMVRKINITSDGARLHVNLSLTKEEFEQQLQYAAAPRNNPSFSGPVRAEGLTNSAAAASAPSGPAAPAPPPGPRKIRIVGLDEGVREIPLDPPSR
jgi:hypothetical protein